MNDLPERLRRLYVSDGTNYVQVDRTAMFETSRNPATGALDDPDDQAALDDIDAVIAQADAALK